MKKIDNLKNSGITGTCIGLNLVFYMNSYNEYKNGI